MSFFFIDCFQEPHAAKAMHQSSKKVILLDGGLGHQLKQYARAIPCESMYQQIWSASALTHNHGKEAVIDIHRRFIQAGSDVITTNTYACTPYMLGNAGMAHRWDELVSAACDLALRAKRTEGTPDVLVAGSLPPMSTSYRPDRVPDDAQLDDMYGHMCGVMASKVDLLICETATSIRESIAATRAASRTGLPVWAACTVREAGRLRSGECVVEWATQVCRYAGALLINCSKPEDTLVALQRLTACNEKYSGGAVRLGAYANRFDDIPADWDLNSDDYALSVREELSCQAYADAAMEWLRRTDASIVGGCCGVSPKYIECLCNTLKGGSVHTVAT